MYRKYSIIITCSFMLLLTTCNQEKLVPIVHTTPISEISYTTASSGGTIETDNGFSVTRRGVCWSIYPNPTPQDNCTEDGTGGGEFVSNITELQPSTEGTKYFLRAFAENKEGIGYGMTLTFTTVPIALAKVTTNEIISPRPTSAICGGNVTSEEGSSVTDYGICWGSSPNPTTSNNPISIGSGLGSFTYNLTNLQPDVTYYVRAYAKNGVGTAYGNQQVFTTPMVIIFNNSLIYGSVTDIDGNIYKTIVIGAQTWMAENLKTTKFNDGTSIDNIVDDNTWSNLLTPAYCWYNHTPDLVKDDYGALYNWYAVNSGKLCPTGWHVASIPEWQILSNFLGGNSIAGGKMKETTTRHWKITNTDVTNSSGLTILPAGNRGGSLSYAGFDNLGNSTYIWTSSEYSITDGKFSGLDRNNAVFIGETEHIKKNYGFAVRCIMN